MPSLTFTPLEIAAIIAGVFWVAAAVSVLIAGLIHLNIERKRRERNARWREWSRALERNAKQQAEVTAIRKFHEHAQQWRPETTKPTPFARKQRIASKGNAEIVRLTPDGPRAA